MFYFINLKWWWIGFILNICFLVNLKLVICNIIDNVLIMNIKFIKINDNFWLSIIEIVVNILFKVKLFVFFINILVGLMLYGKNFKSVNNIMI